MVTRELSLWGHVVAVVISIVIHLHGVYGQGELLLLASEIIPHLLHCKQYQWDFTIIGIVIYTYVLWTITSVINVVIFNKLRDIVVDKMLRRAAFKHSLNVRTRLQNLK
jgi:hypothetical protein